MDPTATTTGTITGTATEILTLPEAGVDMEATEAVGPDTISTEGREVPRVGLHVVEEEGTLDPVVGTEEDGGGEEPLGTNLTNKTSVLPELN